jgi:DNA-3-methyladenine glycosylase II
MTKTCRCFSTLHQKHVVFSLPYQVGIYHENENIMETSRKRHRQQATEAGNNNNTLDAEEEHEKMQQQHPVLATSSESEDVVNRILDKAGISHHRELKTKDGWCLRKGLRHIVTVQDGKLLPLFEQHGPPSFYNMSTQQQQQQCRHEATENIKAPQNCFQSLCRIVAGQQLAGAAAQAIWKRLLETTQQNLTPRVVLDLAAQDMEGALQKPSGLSKAKARAIVDLAESFASQRLTETLLTTSSEQAVRDALLQIKGVGPWSCDMFLMFYLEKPNVLPLGDLGVRKGIAKLFALENKGKGKKGTLCAVKDASRIHQLLEPYQPFQSLLTYYMWKAADTPNFYKDGEHENSSLKSPSKKASSCTPSSAKSLKRVVTP